MPYNNSQEMGRAISVKDEGLEIARNVSSFDFTGEGVSGDAIGSEVEEDVPGADLSPIDLLNQFNTTYPTCYSEITYTSELPTTITYYEDNTKALTLYTKTITYTSELPTTVTIVDNVNSKTLTITNTYTDGALTSVTKAIS